MKGLGAFVASTAIAGLLVLIPLAILFLVGIEVWGILEHVALFADLNLPFPRIITALLIVIAGLGSAFLLCLLIGLLLKTTLGRWAGNFMDQTITEKIPLIGLIRNLTLSVTGTDREKLVVVEADVHDSGAPMIGFLMETLQDERLVIFVPTAPAITLGHTYIVPPERVKRLDASVAGAANALTQWGVGMGEMYAEQATKSIHS